MQEELDYIYKERQLSEEVVKDFRLGVCDKRGQTFTPHGDLSTISLDYRFRRGVLFPIYDVYDTLVAVSARKVVVLNKKQLRYVNTPYEKSKHLFGLNLTYKDCAQKRSVYVVEGNVDTMMMYQHGLRNVVGMLGSALGIHQLCLLSRFVDEVVLVPDGNEAGEKILKRLGGDRNNTGFLSKFSSLGLTYSSMKLPDDYDPDKFLREKGKESFLQIPKRPLEWEAGK